MSAAQQPFGVQDIPTLLAAARTYRNLIKASPQESLHPESAGAARRVLAQTIKELRRVMQTLTAACQEGKTHIEITVKLNRQGWTAIWHALYINRSLFENNHPLVRELDQAEKTYILSRLTTLVPAVGRMLFDPAFVHPCACREYDYRCN